MTRSRGKCLSFQMLRAMLKTPCRPPPRSVFVVVGPNKVRYGVWDTLLKRSSLFLRQLVLPWTFSVPLPDVKVTAFNVYLSWLYGGALALTVPQDAALIAAEGPCTEWHTLLDAYFLGNYLQDIVFKNAIVDKLVELMDRGLPFHPQLAFCACEQLPPASPVRRLCVEFCAWSVGAPDMAASLRAAETGPDTQDFWKEVLLVVIEAGPDIYTPHGVRPWAMDRCRYHEHSEEFPQCLG
ncbi:MAG: hypothetical protein INR71_05180 [Terriglobus roseus]|nr:hypothetical protein [Terriglobus roseus]